MTRWLVWAVMLGLVAVSVQADDAANTAAWETTVSGGLNLNRGNSENMLLNGTIKADRKGDANEVGLGVEANYGETQVERDGQEVDETNIDNTKAFAKYRRLLDERNYLYLNGDANRDDIADIQYRVTIGPGLGRYFIKNDKITLSAEAGPGYLFEKVADVEDDYAILRAAERCEVKLSEGAKVWESVEYLPRIDDFDQYLINAELGAEAAMTATLSLRVVLQDKYNSTPAPGKDENDLSLIAGVTWKL